MKAKQIERRPPGVNPSHTTTGTFTTLPEKKYQGLVALPSNHQFSTYPLVRDVIRNAVREFQRMEEFFPTGVVVTKVVDIIDDVYMGVSHSAPNQKDISYLFKKHQFGPQSKVTSKQFKKLLKELSGTKSYIRGEIFKPQTADFTLVESNLGNYFLTDSGLKMLPAIFRHHDVDEDGYVDFFSLLGIFEVLFSTENQPVPPRNVIEALFRQHKLSSRTKLNFKVVKRLLKELLGIKRYPDIISIPKENVVEEKESDLPIPDLPQSEQPASDSVTMKSTMNVQEKSTDPGFQYANSPALNSVTQASDESIPPILTNQEVQPITREIFSKFDTDKKGLITGDDILSAVGEVFDDQSRPRPTKKQVGQVLLDLTLFTKEQITLSDFQKILDVLLQS